MKTVSYTVSNGTAVITMNRPEVKNAINRAMHTDLYEAFQEARRDNEVKVIVLTGTDGAFSSGADLKSIPLEEMAEFDHGKYLEDTYNKLAVLIDDIGKPTVAYMNGTAAGAGLSLALACDFRFAASDAVMALSFLQIGLTPDAGASYFLPRLVGLGKALELGLGQSVTAEEALRAGMIYQIGEPWDFIEALKGVPQPAYGSMKKNMKTGLHSSLEETLQAETSAQRAAGQSEVHRQAVTAFVNRRKN